MTIWLDLAVNPAHQLGKLGQYGNTVIPETARQVVEYITKTYDPRVLSFSECF